MNDAREVQQVHVAKKPTERGKWKPDGKERGIQHFSKDFGALVTLKDAIRADDTIKQLMSGRD